MDIDGTICIPDRLPTNPSVYDYATAKPVQPVIDRMRQLAEDGHTIILHTARGMRTHGGDAAEITKHVLPTLIKWLSEHDVPYSEIHVGKPWGPNVYYVDDRGLSPIEFAYGTPVNFENYIK